MVKKLLVLAVAALLASTPALAGNYQYINAADLKQKIETGQRRLLVDIQVEDEYTEHHIPGAVATYAYPVKSDADKAKLVKFLAQAKDSDEPVIIVCPRGGGGAKRTYEHLKEQGVAESRLLILEGGQSEWPY